MEKFEFSTGGRRWEMEDGEDGQGERQEEGDSAGAVGFGVLPALAGLSHFHFVPAFALRWWSWAAFFAV